MGFSFVLLFHLKLLYELNILSMYMYMYKLVCLFEFSVFFMKMK